MFSSESGSLGIDILPEEDPGCELLSWEVSGRISAVIFVSAVMCSSSGFGKDILPEEDPGCELLSWEISGKIPASE